LRCSGSRIKKKKKKKKKKIQKAPGKSKDIKPEMEIKSDEDGAVLPVVVTEKKPKDRPVVLTNEIKREEEAPVTIINTDKQMLFYRINGARRLLSKVAVFIGSDKTQTYERILDKYEEEVEENNIDPATYKEMIQNTAKNIQLDAEQQKKKKEIRKFQKKRENNNKPVSVAPIRSNKNGTPDEKPIRQSRKKTIFRKATPINFYVKESMPLRKKLEPLIQAIDDQTELLSAIIDIKKEDVRHVRVSRVARHRNNLVIDTYDEKIINQVREGDMQVIMQLNNDNGNDRWIGLKVRRIGHQSISFYVPHGLPQDILNAKFWVQANTYSLERQRDIFQMIASKLRENGTTGIDVLDYILRIKKPDEDFTDEDIKYMHEGLDEYQSAAVNLILNTRFGLIHGPFGAGKTMTENVAIEELVLDQKMPVLVVAQQHNNADDITLKAGKNNKTPVLRFGTDEEKFNEKVRENFSRHDPQAQKTFKKRFESLNSNEGDAGCLMTATLMGGSFDRELAKILSFKEEHSMDKLTMIIDEAAIINYPELITAIFLLKPYKLILIGDHRQFAPYPLSGSLSDREKNKLIEKNVKESSIRRYQTSIFSKLIQLPFNTVVLKCIYRCHQAVVELVQGMGFYPNVELESQSEIVGEVQEDDTLVTIDTSKLEGEWSENAMSISSMDARFIYNQKEAELAVQWAVKFLKGETASGVKVKADEIMFITPHTGQVECIKTEIRRSDLYEFQKHRLIERIFTSRQALGLEADVVIVSMVRSRPDIVYNNGVRKIQKRRHILFEEKPIIADKRLQNVSFTRSGGKKKTVIIGHEPTLTAIGDVGYWKLFNFVSSSQKEMLRKMPFDQMQNNDETFEFEYLINQSI